VKVDTTKSKLFQKDEKLLALQEKLEQRKAERLEAQQTSKIKPSPASLRKTRSLMKDKVCVKQDSDWFRGLT